MEEVVDARVILRIDRVERLGVPLAQPGKPLLHTPSTLQRPACDKKNSWSQGRAPRVVSGRRFEHVDVDSMGRLSDLFRAGFWLHLARRGGAVRAAARQTPAR